MRALPIAAMLALSVACGEAPISEGVVIDKTIDPASTRLVTLCTAYGKYGCAAWTFVPQVDDEDFLLRLEADDGRRGWREVSAETYEDVLIGEVVDFG